MSSKSYLLGHFPALDWRPLEFVDLPSTTSCDLCAVIPQTIFRLECFHSLCEGCYQSVLGSNRRCPLDKQEFVESEVQTLPIRRTRLEKLDVRCCNFSHGCKFVGSLERMKSHFLKDCEFHPLACKKCSATVPRKDIISHYMEEECGAQNTLCSSENASIDGIVIRIGRQIDASLSDIADKLRAMEDWLNSHTLEIDTTKECVTNYAAALHTLEEGQSFSSVTMSNVMRTVSDAFSSIEEQCSNQVASTDDLKNRVISIKETLSTLVGLQKDAAENAASSGGGWKQCAKKLEAMSKRIQDFSPSMEDKLSCMSDMLQASIGYGTHIAFFHVQDVDGLKDRAIVWEVAYSFSDVFALCGYSVKLSVKLSKYDDIMYIGVLLYICRGQKDSLLTWPFLLPYTLIMVHPSDDKKNVRHCVDVPNLFRKYPYCFNRQVESSNSGNGKSQLCKLEDALNDGFVYENAITVGVTLVQSRD
ncbi:TNF receptor-associated factor 4-like [Ornithodoros turicata]|uniref:TNF receptor-associated factor 4-like n=1 Tax=Ornithodoros turicata TaxID=34597 RepID=UPI003138CE97